MICVHYAAMTHSRAMSRKAVAYLLPGDAPVDARPAAALDAWPDAPLEAWPDALEVIETVRETDPAGRAGLRQALETIVAGQAEVLLTQRLGASASSLADLIRLLDWLEDHQASLVALDLRLDTGLAEGRRTVLALREVDRWSRQPGGPRKLPGRPGLQTTAPGVAERIALMRGQGLSLHAIAEALNGLGIPTPRGGARWRASSVQSSLGYRRPRPPAPGLPPPVPARPRGPRGAPAQRGARPSGPPGTPGTAGPAPRPRRKGL